MIKIDQSVTTHDLNASQLRAKVAMTSALMSFRGHALDDNAHLNLSEVDIETLSECTVQDLCRSAAGAIKFCAPLYSIKAAEILSDV